MNESNKLYYIVFRSADGEFFASRYGRFACVEDLIFDLRPYFKRFAGHSATWEVLPE